jgi:hypothetical protein
MKRFAALGAWVVLLSSACVSGQVLEDFEHGNEALWGFAGTTVDNMDLLAASAHDGNFGAGFLVGSNPAFRTRFDVPTAPGNSYFAYVRMRGGAVSGRVYLGVGATAAGAWSAVFAPNTSQIVLQNNSGWGFVNQAVASYALVPDVWYRLRLDWAANGDMTVKLLNEAGTSELAATPVVATGYTTAGGVALRGFSTLSAVTLDLDTISKVGPTCYADCNGDGVLGLADFGCFQTKFALGDPYADCNGDGVLGLADFGCFQTKFALGCP